MTTDTYKQALKQAKADLVEQVKTLGRAQDSAAKAEKAIVELRQTIAALQVLCGEPEFVEEDALGLTDAIRMAFRTAGREMSAHDVREQMESMGYAGRWGNLLASIQTVIPRLFKKGEIRVQATSTAETHFVGLDTLSRRQMLTQAECVNWETWLENAKPDRLRFLPVPAQFRLLPDRRGKLCRLKMIWNKGPLQLRGDRAGGCS